MSEKLNNSPKQWDFSRHKKAWDTNPAIRKLYSKWYENIVSSLSPGKNNLEIGCGSGNFKEYFPDIQASDIGDNPYADENIKAEDINRRDSSVDNLVLINVLHHLKEPFKFFQEAERVLRKGGRLVILDHYISLFGSFVYKHTHHEPILMEEDYFDGKPSANNGAAGTLIFGKYLSHFKINFQKLVIVEINYLSFLSHPLARAFSKPSFISLFLLDILLFIEDLLKPFMKFFGLRMLVVIEKV